MNLNNYAESKVRGLLHLERKMQPDDQERFADRIYFLETGTGSRSGCLGNLGAACQIRAMLAYFRDGDIVATKHWAYLSSKARIMLAHLEVGNDYLTEDLLWPLLSDNEEVIDWYRQNQSMYHPEKPSIDGGDKDNPKSWMYYRYQSWLALNKRWDELGERCERILAIKDEIKKDRSYLIDHRFYLALARGDAMAMANVLMEKVTPAQRKRRYLQQSGVTWDLIDSYATVFAKLAWRSGYELDLDTPWIPKEWLPVKPLDKYEDPWPFMQNFDIWQPFAEPYAKYSPRRPLAGI